MGTLFSQLTGARINLGARVMVGRSTICAFRLTDKRISGEHALLWWSEGGWWIRDLGSRNGTFRGGQPLTPGEALRLEAGDRLSFGRPTGGWLFEESGPPTLTATHLLTGERRRAEGGLLCLPDAERPELTVFQSAEGRWVVEMDGDALQLDDELAVEVDGEPWRLSCPRGVTELLPSTREAPSTFSLFFGVSVDEEHVEVRVRYGGHDLSLDPRVYHYTLLTLARARIADQARGEADEGWVYAEDLMKMLRLDRTTLNLHVFRCRKQLADLQVPSAGEIIERRALTRQLRIGTPLLEVVTL